MQWKKYGKALLFPPFALCILLLPVSIGALVYAFLHLAESDPLRFVAYLLSFYTLCIWCARIPALVHRIHRFKQENPYAQIWLGDARLRVNVSLGGSVLCNTAYAILQLGLGFYHHMAWFYSLAGYYLLLACVRLFLVRHTLRTPTGTEMRRELHRYRICGWVFLLMNLSLSTMIFYMIHENSVVRHHEITTIAMAAYTFAALTVAIVNVVKYRKYNSPVFSASKAISLAAACVSMLTLERTMLATFGGTDMTPQIQHTFLALSGGAVSIFIIAMAIYMIIQANQKLNKQGD